MVREVYDKKSGAILFKRDQADKDISYLVKTIESLEKKVSSLEKKIKKLELK